MHPPLRTLAVLVLTVVAQGAPGSVISIVRLHQPFIHGRAPVWLNGQWGYIDPSGMLVIDPTYDDAKPFCLDGTAPVLTESGWSYIDPQGKVTVTVEEDDPYEPGCFSEDLLAVNTGHGGEGYFIDRRGKVVLAGFHEVSQFSEGLAAVQVDRDGPWGYIDHEGILRILPRYEVALPFSEGRAAVMIGDEYGFIDREGTLVIPAQFRRAESFSQGRAVVMRPPGWTNVYASIDPQGSFVTRESYRFLGDLSEGLAAFTTSGSSGYLDRAGSRVFEVPAGNVREFSQGLAAAERDGRWGFIDKKGRWVIPPRYDEADSFSEGRAAVNLGDELLFIDRKGKVVWRSGPVEARLEQKEREERERKRLATGRPVDDPYGETPTEALLDLLINEGRIDVLRTLAARLPVDSLIGAVHQRLPEVTSRLPATWILDRRSEESLFGLTVADLVNGGDGATHVALHETSFVAGPDHLGNDHRWRSSLVYMKGTSGGWSEPVTIEAELNATETILLPSESGIALLTKVGNDQPSTVQDVPPGHAQLIVAENTGSGRSKRFLLHDSARMLGSFDVCRAEDGRWQVAWSPWESDDVDQPLLAAPIQEGPLKPEVVLRRKGHDLGDAVWVDCGTKLLTVSQNSKSLETKLLLYQKEETGWSNGLPLELDVDFETIATRTEPRVTASVVHDGPDTTVFPLQLAPEIHRLPPISVPADILRRVWQLVGLIEFQDGSVGVLGRYENVVLFIRCGPAGSEAAPVWLPGDGRLAIDDFIQSGDRVRLGFSRAQESLARVGLADIDIETLDWGPLQKVLIRLTPAVSRDPAGNFLIRALRQQARQLYDSGHWPAAIDLLDRLVSARVDMGSAQQLREMCEVHRDLGVCLRYRTR